MFTMTIIFQVQHQRFLGAAGGGGRKGIALLPEVVEPDEEDARRVFSVVGLEWPGIEIENVCPSFKL